MNTLAQAPTTRDRHALTLAETAVIAWVRFGLTHAGDRPSAPPKLDLDWSQVPTLIYDHRLGNLVAEAIRCLGDAVPGYVADRVANFRAITSRMNGNNLLTMRRVVPEFEKAGLSFVVFKGPLQQQQIYGSLFVRPSSDLDLLVAPADFGRSGPLLHRSGYVLAKECRSIWWRAGLGEQHFQSAGSAAVTIDLHHRLQQPGCPLPADPGTFLEQREPVVIAGQSLPSLSPVHTQLLSAMSLVKALHHREPCARYAIDLWALGRRHDADHWDRVRAEAGRQGLTNTLELALRGARLLFPDETSLPMSSGTVLPEVDDRCLATMILRPADPGLVWPRRRRLLEALTDRKRDYLSHLSLMIGSDLLRQTAGLTQWSRTSGRRDA